MLKATIELENVDISGSKFKGTIELKELYLALKRPFIHYCPATQRGEFNPDRPDDIINIDYDTLHPITYNNLSLDDNKVNEMAIQYLRGQLYWSELIWNARNDPDYPSLEYDNTSRVLRIYSTITIPDSAHRHKCYYRIFEWKNNIDTIPEKVVLSEIQSTFTKKDIIDLVSKFDENVVESVTVHNLTPKQEGELFRQLNILTKRANPAQIIRSNPDMNSTTRFIHHLMKICEIFSTKEIETNRTSIHQKSKKLVPISTLSSAIKPYSNLLQKIEEQKGAYNDLVLFVDDFFKRLAENYKEMQPETAREIRQESRKNKSFIIVNVMFIALFKIAFEAWKIFYNNSIPWRNNPKYIQLVSQLNKNVSVIVKLEDGTESVEEVNIMSRRNSHWVGKIVNDRYRISNNYPSQEAAYKYLACESGLENLKTQLNQQLGSNSA